MALILGIDPGSRHLGFGLLDATKNIAVHSGVVHAKSEILAERLLTIYQALEEILATYRPAIVAIEQVFVKEFPHSALILGHARGVALLAAKKFDLPIYEYAARTVKQTIVGSGAADKKQVQFMIRHLLKLTTTPSSDAADALAIALCHHYHVTNRLLHV